MWVLNSNLLLIKIEPNFSDHRHGQFNYSFRGGSSFSLGQSAPFLAQYTEEMGAVEFKVVTFWA